VRKRAKTWASDRELVDQILAGNREQFDLLYETYFPRVYRFALKRLGDPGEAEDVAQDVFVILMRALGSYRAQSSLLEPVEEGGALDVAGPEVATDEIVEARRMLSRCEEIIECQLTPLQRRIFHLKHLRRQPIRTIAKALGKSEDAIKANLYRMRRAIAEGTPGLEGLLRS